MSTASPLLSVLGKNGIAKTFDWSTLPSPGKRNLKLRAIQTRIVRDYLLKFNKTVIVAPTGSGKSVAILCYAAENGNRNKGTIILVPKLTIASGFLRYVKGHDFSAYDAQGSFTIVAEGVMTPEREKTDTLEREIANGPMTGIPSIIVCSYQAFAMAMERVTPEQLKKFSVIVDEFHHSASDPGEETQEDKDRDNDLGSIVRGLCENDIETHCFTATDYRSDGLPLIPPEYVEQFQRLHYPLYEHYLAGDCPDFDMHFVFYDKVKVEQHDEMSNLDNLTGTTFNLTSGNKLIDSYVKTYFENQRQTLMIIPQRPKCRLGEQMNAAAMAKALEIALVKEAKRRGTTLEIMQLGSRDGKKLESTRSDIDKKYDEFSDPKWDIFISINIMSEGADWPDCAQTFNPGVSGSLIKIMQEAVGRSLRKKDPSRHKSPDKSHVWFFELGIDQDNSDNPVVSESLFRLAIRIKSIIYGHEFQQPFNIRKASWPLSIKEQEEAEREVDEVLSLPANEQQEIAEYLNSQTVNLDMPELIKLTMECCEVGHHAAAAILAGMDILKRDNEVINLSVRTAYGRDFDEFCTFLRDRDYVINGSEQYVEMLNGLRHTGLRQILKQYVLLSAQEKKAKLLEIAANGEPRPKQGKHPLGCPLSQYTSSRSSSFDPDFRIQIYTARPDWSPDYRSNESITTKQRLIELARSGVSRPIQQKTRDGKLLNGYLSRDPIFAQTIRSIRPDWFEDTVAKNKATLLTLAKQGAARPPCSTIIGCLLRNYLSPVNNCYDPDFSAKIRILAPHWFIDRHKANKDMLFAMAERGDPKPTTATPMGKLLDSYMRHSDFSAEIMKRGPHWFSDPVADAKHMLIEMAKRGDPRPKQREKIGHRLCRYTSKKDQYYDSDFDSTIRSLRPDWFADTKTINKALLLNMAKTGKPKPHYTAKLCHILHSYTIRSCRSYDYDFDAKIRTLRPDWFKARKEPSNAAT